MMVAKPTLHDLRFLCERARPDEIEQWVALTGTPWEPEIVAADLAARVGPQFVLLDKRGTPVVAGGFEYLIPGVWQAWMVGTVDGWRQHWRAITLNTNRIMRMVLRHERRIELLALASRTQTCTWYERGLRMQREGTSRGFGVNGEDAVRYARVSGEHNG
jgi:hypothetical protein